MIVEHRKHPKNFSEWKCGGCQQLLGLAYLDKTMAIKHKELVLWVRGDIRIICRRCKQINSYNSYTNLNDLIDSSTKTL